MNFDKPKNLESLFPLSLLTLLICIILISCNSSKEKNSSIKNEPSENIDVTKISSSILENLQPIHLDTSNYTIIRNTGLENGKSNTIYRNEIEKIETILNQCVSNYNKTALHHLDSIYNTHPNYDLIKHENVIINVAQYKIQFIPWNNKIGEKEVLVYGFCYDPCPDKNRWRKSIVHNFDGTTCCFGVKLNLTKVKTMNCGQWG